MTFVPGVYSTRADKGKITVSCNENLGFRGNIVEPSDLKPLGLRARVAADDEDFDNVKARYRYMFTPLNERAQIMDKQLLRMQEHMCKIANIEESNLQPVGIASPDMVWCCGRICCDAPEGRINSSSVVLEGSYQQSRGRRVSLDLSGINAYSLFPGQIVLVEGINASGRNFVVKQIVEGIPRAIASIELPKLLEYHHSTYYQKGQPLSVVVAAGPFTTADNLSYEPLEDLLRSILKTKPDVVILIGPFVDISHPLLENGDVVLFEKEDGDVEMTSQSASYEMVFIKRIITEGFRVMFNSESEPTIGTIATNFVLVPSLLDGHHEFVYPQPPFGNRDVIKSNFFEEDIGDLSIPFSSDKDPRKRIHLMPNPCMFRYVIACQSKKSHFISCRLNLNSAFS